MTNDNDEIPIVETYRGVGLHDQQSEERLAVVRRALDRVFDQHDFERLFEIARDVTWPPEARLFAAAKLEAAFEIAVDERRERPPIDLLRVGAAVPGLSSQRWRDPWSYCSLLDPGPRPGQPGAVKRERDLTDLRHAQRLTNKD
ncbi:hypothetical protein V5279_24490 [Bradyrhizobium sp. 26S5]|uniref:hypothetical protein n=1 Tax=Bradyrhizobium sp. 26S5 TaxID=3139729 RepID=UPI0030D0A3BA